MASQSGWISSDDPRILDSGYSSAVENLVTDSTSHGIPHDQLPKMHSGTEGSKLASSIPNIKSFDNISSLSRRSSGKASIKSHRSICAIGGHALGTLRITNEDMDSEDPEEMPALESVPEPASPGQTGDIFLILDLPQGVDVGCDAEAINTASSEFRGICDLPVGTHFIWIQEPSGMSSRCGYWFVTDENKGKVRAKQWNCYNEILDEVATKCEMRDLKEDISTYYDKLIPFRHQEELVQSSLPTDLQFGINGEKWQQLTWAISENLLTRVTGKQVGEEWRVDTSDPEKGVSHFPYTRQIFQASVSCELEFLFPESDVDLSRLSISDAGSTSSSASMRSTSTVMSTSTIVGADVSNDILRTLDTPGRGIVEADIVGELQFVFITGLHLSNLACIGHWWHLILRVLLRAPRLFVSRPSLCRRLLETFHAQMVYNEKCIAGESDHTATLMDDETTRTTKRPTAGNDAGTDILETNLQNKNKLRDALIAYKQRLGDAVLSVPKDQFTAEHVAASAAFTDLETWFWTFGWDLRTDHNLDHLSVSSRSEVATERGTSDVDDEYAPVIVEFDENGKEIGLLSW